MAVTCLTSVNQFPLIACLLTKGIRPTLAKTSIINTAHLDSELESLTYEIELHRLEQQRLGIANQAAAFIDREHSSNT